MNEKEYLIALCSFTDCGPARTNLLIQYFGNARNAWNASSKSLVEIGLKKNVVEDFGRHKRDFNFQKYFDRLKKLSIDVVTVNDDSYPENLRDLDDAPLVLYIRGKLSKNDTNSIAIVGSRKMNSYGREVTQKLSSELASLGITIVSGLAFGVDLEAHKSALGVGGRCIAVLAGGVDIITPRSK